MLSDKHRQEWVEQSGVSPEITARNVVTLEDHREIDKRLDRNTKSRWKHTDWGEGGFWVTGVDPKTGERWRNGGQFKPDKPLDKRKYIGISDSVASPLFLGMEDRHYWQQILETNSPVIITEGAKKAGALMTAGLAAISLPGVTTGQKLGRLKQDLTPFFNVGRRVYLCFDSDVMTKQSVQQALDRLGRLMAETGANISIIELPQETKGTDDYLVKYGVANLLELIEKAKTFEEWRDFLKEQDPIESPKSNRQRTYEAIRSSYGKRLRLNIMTKQVEMDGTPLSSDLLYLDLLETGIDASKEFVSDCFLKLASKNEHHPVQDYLLTCKLKYGDESLSLLDNCATRYLGAKNEIFNTFLRKTLIAAVARAFVDSTPKTKKEGVKVDTALILQGRQGKRKSAFLMF